MTNKNRFQILIEFFMLTIGSIIAAFAIEEFLVPNTILDGGVIGIGIMINNLTKLPLSMLTIILNIPFLLFGLHKLGKIFIIKAAYCMIIFSLFVSLFAPWTNATDETFLAVCYGGVILGIGVGLIIKFGGCLDGTETVAIILNRKFGLAVGQMVLIMNLVIYSIAGILFGPDRAMYSLLTYFITSKVLDVVENGVNTAKAATIITDDAKEISDKIYQTLGRTVTLMEGEGLVSGKKDVLTLFMFLLVASRLYDPMQAALQNLAAVIAMRTNVARMNEILDHEIQQGSDTLTNKGSDITFDHVGFAYKSGETVLSDVSFTARQGEVTALVGPSGGGKSTLASLISRFFYVNSGSIKIGGVDVRDISKDELMNTVSFVFQNSKLIKASILDNVKMGKSNATDEEVLNALRAAQCMDIIEKFPDGVNTVIGSRGVYLSGGEMQRIAIARVMLKNSPIIILDEATAFADPDNESRVQKAFSMLSKEKTVIMIAHRLSTVVGADNIFVLQNGHVVEQGTCRELVEQNGLFSQMWHDYQTSVKWKVAKEG